jgi:hypothetical protein
MSTTWTELEGAALSLARSGSIKDRLLDAYRNHLALVNVEELPEALRADFRACQESLTRERPLRGEDAVRATVRKMSGQEADDVACSLVRLFAAAVRESVRPVASAPAPALVLNAASAVAPTRAKVLKSVPQVISRYATAEA